MTEGFDLDPKRLTVVSRLMRRTEEEPLRAGKPTHPMPVLRPPQRLLEQQKQATSCLGSGRGRRPETSVRRETVLSINISIA